MPRSKQSARSNSPGIAGPTARSTRFFERELTRYRDLTTRRLVELLPSDGPLYLYDLVSVYPQRLGKGLRAALCLAICNALGGDERKALNSAVAVELFHNAFLIPTMSMTQASSDAVVQHYIANTVWGLA